MSPVAGVPPVVDGARDAIDARFADLCKRELRLDEGSSRPAIVLFRDSKPFLSSNMSSIGNGTPEDAERYWSAFVLYCTMKVKQEKNEKGATLTQILRATRLNFLDFFKESQQIAPKVKHILSGMYGSDWSKKFELELSENKNNVSHLLHLSRYYKRLYQELFLPDETSNDQDSTSGKSVCSSKYHQFGWLLFLALREHAFSHFRDLVTCINGLLSVLAILILHVPVNLRNFKVDASPLFAKKSEKGIKVLACLSEKHQTTEAVLAEIMGQSNGLITTLLKRKGCPAAECRKDTLDSIDPDGLVYFEDLFEESSLQESLIVLEKDHENVIDAKCEPDERLFVNSRDSILGSGSLSLGPINLSGAKRKLDMMSSPTKTVTSAMSPSHSSASSMNGNHVSSNIMASSTPITTAMATAKWLRDIISPLPSKPSSELHRFFSSCGCDVTSHIIRRAKVILEAVFPSCTIGQQNISKILQDTNLMNNIWAEQRKAEALKLYYRVLEAMCRAESQILNGSNLTSLLSNERFHRCMLACSAELVVATHKTVSVSLSEILERTGITAFDLSKVIESYVRHEETLPRELKRHLNSLEERLLESIAWGKGSSMYNSLIVARPSLSAEVNRLGLLAEPMPSLDTIAKRNVISNGNLMPSSNKFETSPVCQNGDGRSPKRICGENNSVNVDRNSTSPVKEQLPTSISLKSKLAPLQPAFASPTRPNPTGEGETCAETGINMVFNKIVKLAAIRIKSLCEKMQLPQQILERVYALTQKILHQRTALFFNRHIDQIILCSFYGVAKICQSSLTFKEIIYNYRKQPQCKPQVFRSVFVNWTSSSLNAKVGEEHVDIITFYNEVFIPLVKPLLVELGPVGCNPKPSNRVTEDKNVVDGKSPASPRISPFPSLPDMSPKKISSAHNVYVSPLRASKMENLLSPSSKSYYACVGESTHAYQSPSKDLTAINNRLNGGRKVRLNFDMVSDSTVAGSFGLQNGSSLPAKDVSSQTPVKQEQP